MTAAAASNRRNREQHFESLGISWGSAAARHAYAIGVLIFLLADRLASIR